ncbi:MAG: DUF4166 domain-containing protein [Pseudomonadota bacterium]
MTGDPFWQVIEAQDLPVPSAVLALHKGAGERRFEGRARVDRGTHPIVRIGLWASGFPPQSDDVPVMLTIRVGDHGAEWIRNFGGHITRSRLWFDAEKIAVKEKLGPFQLTLGLRVEKGQLRMKISGFSLWGLPLPRWCHPISQTREFEDSEGRFGFDVSGRMPGFGPIIRYVGHLAPV